LTNRIVSGFLFTMLLLGMLMLTSDVHANALKLVDTIALDKEPHNIAVNEQTNLVYISVEDGIIVLDGNTRKIVTEIHLDHNTTYGLVVNPQTNRIFVSTSERVYVINGDTNQVMDEIAQNVYHENEIALNPVTNVVYIADPTHIKDTYDRIDAYEYVNITYLGYHWFINASINIPDSNVPLYVHAVHVAVNPRTNRIYATWSGNNTLYTIDGNTNTIVKTTHYVGDYSTIKGCNPFTNYVYFLGRAWDGETLENVTSSILGTFEAANSLYNRIYTIKSGTIYVLDGYTHEQLSSLRLSEIIINLAVNPKTGDIYALGDRKLFVLQEPVGPTTRTYTPYERKVEVSSNSSVSEFQFNGTTKQISFKVIGANGTNGFCNITFPNDLLWGTISIYKDGSFLVKDVDYTQTYNATHYTFHIIYDHSTHTMEILGTEAIPEFPITCMLLLFMAATLLGVIAYKRRYWH